MKETSPELQAIAAIMAALLAEREVSDPLSAGLLAESLKAQLRRGMAEGPERTRLLDIIARYDITSIEKT